MGTFHLNNATFALFQSHVFAASNASGDCDHYNCSAGVVGDHIDAFYRYDDGGDPNYNGTYDRIPSFFAFPANGALVTLCDASVKQLSTDTLPAVYQQSNSTGTGWQDGAAFTSFVGPPLATDPAGSQRVYAFFNAETWPPDQGIGGHLIGFASVVAPAGTNNITPLWNGAWKDATSPNDGDYKLANSIPLRTLYLKQFTPVIAFRGDVGIRLQTPSPQVPIDGGRYPVGYTGWYRDGYFYLFMTTTLSYETTDGSHCYGPPTATSRGTLAMALFRIRADLTGTSGFGGLYLDSSKRPQVELYRSTTTGGPKSFITLPHPENVVSFSDDNLPKTGDGCTDDNRQYFSGCCDNPAVHASTALITYPNRSGDTLGVSANFVWNDACSRYIVLNPMNRQMPDAAVWQPSTAYAVGQFANPTSSAFQTLVCVQGGTSGQSEPSWPMDDWNPNLPPPDPSGAISDGSVIWKVARVALLLRARDNASQCGVGDPQYTFEDAGLLTMPYPPGYRHGQFYLPWANLSPLPGTTDTLLGYRHVENVASGTEGQQSFTVLPNLQNCRFAVSPTTSSVGSAAASLTLTISSPETRCVWSASSNVAFITVDGSSRVGSTTVTATISQNTSGSSRSGTITVAGQTVTVSQAAASAPACTSFTLSLTSITITGSATSRVVNITGSPAGCQGGAWSTASNTPWLSVSPSSGSGSGTAQIVAAANVGAPRSTSATIAGSGLSVIQLGPPCSRTGRAVGDYNCDGRTEVSVYRPSNSTWYFSTGESVQWGAPGDIAAPADYDGDGETDLAVFRPSNGTWYILQSTDATTRVVSYGSNGDIPAPADYDGDGKADLAVFRPSTYVYYVLPSSTNITRSYQLTESGKVAPADYDGDGKADPAIENPNNGHWYIVQSSNGATRFVQWGGSGGDIPAPADYDGDGKADVTIESPCDGKWYTILSHNGGTQITTWGGSCGDQPQPGDYNGDGIVDIATFEECSSTMYIIENGATVIVSIGQCSDIAVSSYRPGR